MESLVQVDVSSQTSDDEFERYGYLDSETRGEKGAICGYPWSVITRGHTLMLHMYIWAVYHLTFNPSTLRSARMAVEQRRVAAENLIKTVETDTGVVLTREQAAGVLTADWLATSSSPLTSDRVPARDKMHNNN